MNIQELENYNLADAVKFHSRLNPRIWDRSEHMLPEVRKRLLAAAEDFREFLGVQDLELEDITISGSNAAYTYTPHSDIDLHLVVRRPDDEVYRELFDAKKFQYNSEHDIRIGTYPVELYVQDADQPAVSQGVYSLLTGKWIQVPQRRRVKINDSNVRDKYDNLQHKIEQAIASGSVDQMQTMLTRLRQMRQAGLDQHGEFGAENLAFKMLRNQGVIDRLRSARNQARDQELSLAERQLQTRQVRYGYGRMAEGTPDGVSASTKMFVSEKLNPESHIQAFVDFCVDQLSLQDPPHMKLHSDPDWPTQHGTFGRYLPDQHVLEISTHGRHIMDVFRTIAHELTHQRQHEVESVPDTAGHTGSRWENQANAQAGVIMRNYSRLHPEMFNSEPVHESSGYIPTRAQAQDPRYVMALTQDIQPGETGRQANRMRLQTDSQGHPALLIKNAANQVK
jgi:predicted nucleotidyltransferase